MLTGPSIGKAFKDITDDFTALRAMNNIHAIGDKELVEQFSKMKSFSDMGLKQNGKVLTTQKYIELLGDLDVDALLKNASDSEVFKKELAKLIKTTAHDTHGMAKGAQHHLAMVVEWSKHSNKVIRGLEIRVDAATGNRVMDMVVEIAGKTVNVEAKNWQRSLWKERFRNALSRKVSKKAAEAAKESADDTAEVVAKETGQLVRDIARNSDDIRGGNLDDLDVVWYLAPDGLPDLSPGSIAAAEKEARDIILDLVRNPSQKKIRHDIASKFNLDLNEEVGEDAFEELIEIGGGLELALEKMIKIEPYDKIVESLSK